MMNEETLTKYYTAIAQKLDELIPCEWEKVALYAEQGEGVSAVRFYFYTEDGNYHDSGFLWEEYDVTEEKCTDLLVELMDINENLWHEFKNSGEETWYSYTFKLDKDYKFNMKYSYEKIKATEEMDTEANWAYDELGIIPPDDYTRELLKNYLLKQKRELPEELKDI